ncbi:hypothetical protein PAEPH01_0874 [Pancytospora epiphaga]|nr:hypothetical protein PAEPH01_0874 [Pancytospora epiphaga]
MALSLDPNFVIDAAEALSESIHLNVFDEKTKPSDYKIIRTLAKGGYGEVYVVEHGSGVYAMKKVPKDLVRKNPNTTFFMNEKDVMTCANSEWIVTCHAAIQDRFFLYYIMDFIPGGDLMCYLSRVDVISEAEIKFYAAEIFMAITAMHEQGWIHRDLKPDNILIDSEGHIKLGDFGSCIRMKDRMAESSVTVGTPDYLSPDLLVTVGSSVNFGTEVDFWTVGVIIYEMLYGTTPFYADSLRETYHNISTFNFTLNEPISIHLRDLINGLLCPKDVRLNIAEVMDHPFFEGIDWNNLRQITPPYKPSIKDSSDVSNFVDTEFVPDSNKIECGFKDFIGFTYDPQFCRSFLRSILESDMVKKHSPEFYKYNNTSDHASLTLTANDEIEKIITEEESIKEALIVEKRKELQNQINELERERENKELLVLECTQSIENIMSQLKYKKEEYEALVDSIHNAREELRNIKQDITDRLASIENLKTKEEEEGKAERVPVNYLGIQESIKDIRKLFERAKFNEKMAGIKKIAYWLYKENNSLKHKLKTQAIDADIENRGIEELKRELRIKRTEIREYQQKIDQEGQARRQLEEQMKSLKLSIRSEVKPEQTRTYKVTNLMSNKEMNICVERDKIIVSDDKSGSNQRECLLGNIHVRGLKNNELHHLSVKKRGLCVKVFFLGEVCKSSSSGTRRSLKALEKDLEKENKILQGLRGIMSVLSGATLQDAIAQQKGSEKKIKQLLDEIERAKKSTITEFEVPDDEKVAEFNNHLFYERTVGKGTLCDHCNEVLYGVYNQAYMCKDCLLVVHKTCYVLVEESCELNQAMRSGTSLSVLCHSPAEREGLIKLSKLY